MLIELNATHELQAIGEATEISKQNKGQYVIVVPNFGLFASVTPSLNAQAPSDTPFNWYVLNGLVKNFTDAQHTANQIATPALA